MKIWFLQTKDVDKQWTKTGVPEECAPRDKRVVLTTRWKVILKAVYLIMMKNKTNTEAQPMIKLKFTALLKKFREEADT